jgi:hypothetical protein
MFILLSLNKAISTSNRRHVHPQFIPLLFDRSFLQFLLQLDKVKAKSLAEFSIGSFQRLTEIKMLLTILDK